MNEWLVIDKVGDDHYFKNTKDIATYFNLTIPQINSVYTFSLQNINKYSPSKGIYIQRLFMNRHLPPRDATKIKFNRWAKYNFYNNIK